ncbi:MAG: sugar ABC transporter substrate-binding protein [Spirochaetaceae bacterium]|jgi:multiple sugar transport system substrate-binding protein|nr:sugar ABC transporter substrate-binding protein [Spirochaetaceae bacterium]
MKKIWRFPWAIVLGCVFWAGCSGGKKVEVRFATWDNAEDLDNQQALVDRFNQAHTDIRVVLEAYGDNFDTKIAASMGSNDAPDVMYMWNYPAYYEGLESLNSYIDKEGSSFRNNYYEAMWAYNSINNTIYGMPVGYTTHVLYYNKDMFDAAGIGYPAKDWTYNDVYAAAKAITEHYNDGSTKGYVFPIQYDPYDFEMYLWSNGTSFVNGEGRTKGSLDSPQSISVFSFFQKMEADGYAIAAENYGTSTMTSQKAAMFVNGSWPIAQLNEAGINFGVVEIPRWGPNPSVSILSSSGLAMSKSSAHKDAAWEFIKFWTGEEANIDRIEYELPVLKTVVSSQNIENDPVKKVFYDMLEQSQGYVPASFIVKDWSSLGSDLELGFERIFNPTTLEDPAIVLGEIAGKRN